MYIAEKSNNHLGYRDESFSYHAVKKEKEVENLGGNLRNRKKRSGRIIIHLVGILKKKN